MDWHPEVGRKKNRLVKVGSQAREVCAEMFKVLKGESYLKNRYAKPATFAHYRQQAAEFEKWCTTRRIPSTSVQQFDVAMSRYLDWLFFQGEHIATARYIGCGKISIRGMSLYRRDFPILYKQPDGGTKPPRFRGFFRQPVPCLSSLTATSDLLRL